MTSHAPIVAGLSMLAALAGTARADIVTEWNDAVLNAIQSTATAPPPATRAMAMMHTAMYDANNAVTLARRSYLPIPAAPSTASREAAVAQAARDVLVSLFPTQAGAFNTLLADQLSGISPGQSRDDGVALGSTVASNFLAHRSGDGTTAPTPWTPGNTPVSWRPTGASPIPLFNQYAVSQPWTMTACDQFRQAAPPMPGSAEYAAAYEEVKQLGGTTSASRTPDQTEIAKFWAAGGGTPTPPGLWNRIAKAVSTANNSTFDENLSLFALLNLATADAAVCAWDMKLVYDYYRPVTPIRDEDPTWTSLIPTPQFQAYTSGHSTFSAAAAAVLASLYGDATSFDLTVTDPALGLFNVTRSYVSFSGAAEEAGISRIYGGIHWQFDNTAGLASGNLIGHQVFENYLRIPGPGVGVLLGIAGIRAARRRR